MRISALTPWVSHEASRTAGAWGSVPCGFLAAAWNLPEARPSTSRIRHRTCRSKARLYGLSPNKQQGNIMSVCGLGSGAGLGQGWPPKMRLPSCYRGTHTGQTRRRRLCWCEEGEALSAGAPALPRWALHAATGVLPSRGQTELCHPQSGGPRGARAERAVERLALRMVAMWPQAKAGRDQNRSPSGLQRGHGAACTLISAHDTDSGLVASGRRRENKRPVLTAEFVVFCGSGPGHS